MSATSFPVTFLGTGNFHVPGRYWNSFLLDGHILVEASPTALPNLRRVQIDPIAIDVILLSHFHADHTFGWPFLLLDRLIQGDRPTDLWVVGPPGVEAFLREMVHAGALDRPVQTLQSQSSNLGLHFLEVNEEEQEAGPLRFRAVRVEHAPELDCYGFLLYYRGRRIGYSGDTQLCDGLRTIASGAEALVLECNERHASGRGDHMSLDSVRTLRHEFENLPFILTHVGAGVEARGITRTRLPNDLETIEL
jgi:ribonuclease Z